MSETRNTVVIRWLERVFNRYAALDPEMPDRVASFSGRIICLDITGFESKIYLMPGQHGISITLSCESEPDTTITGTPAALMKMGFLTDSEPLLLSGEVEIKGDTRLAKEFKRLLDDMDVDWEELLSSRVGDMAAHHIFNTAKKMTHWGQYLKNAVMQDISEYLQEESRVVVTDTELELFNREVDRLRDDTDRLQARIQRLTTDNAH